MGLSSEQMKVDHRHRLLDRRRRALRELPALEEIVRGSVFTRRVRCGKPGCRCARGAPHTATCLTVSFAGGRTEQISLPADLVPVARRWVANYRAWWKAVEAISAANRELLRRREVSPQRASARRRNPP
jgi:hypothetical protein